MEAILIRRERAHPDSSPEARPLTAATVLVGALSLNAAIGVGYHTYRLTRGGPLSDVTGQAILGALLTLVAVGVAQGWAPARWISLAYALIWGLVVMPIWVLAVLIPMGPRWHDYAFTGVYWVGLGIVAAASIAAA
jgi:hypothetical protein